MSVTLKIMQAAGNFSIFKFAFLPRKLENEIENLEEKIDDVAKTHRQELRK
jgi:hypothetical protein